MLPESRAGSAAECADPITPAWNRCLLDGTATLGRPQCHASAVYHAGPQHKGVDMWVAVSLGKCHLHHVWLRTLFAMHLELWVEPSEFEMIMINVHLLGSRGDDGSCPAHRQAHLLSGFLLSCSLRGHDHLHLVPVQLVFRILRLLGCLCGSCSSCSRSGLCCSLRLLLCTESSCQSSAAVMCHPLLRLRTVQHWMRHCRPWE